MSLLSPSTSHHVSKLVQNTSTYAGAENLDEVLGHRFELKFREAQTAKKLGCGMDSIWGASPL